MTRVPTRIPRKTASVEYSSYSPLYVKLCMVLPRKTGIRVRSPYYMFALIPVRPGSVRPKGGFVRPNNYNYVGY